MDRIVLSLAVTLCFVAVTYATECPYGITQVILTKISKSAARCPRIFDPSDKAYCCEDTGCCCLTHYIFSGYRLIIVLLVALVGIGLGIFFYCRLRLRVKGGKQNIRV